MSENPFSVIQGFDAGEDMRKAIAARVRAFMALKLISDSELAAHLGQNQQWFSRRKLGHVSFAAEDLLTIANYLEISINDLYGIGTPSGPGTPVDISSKRARQDSNLQPTD